MIVKSIWVFGLNSYLLAQVLNFDSCEWNLGIHARIWSMDAYSFTRLAWIVRMGSSASMLKYSFDCVTWLHLSFQV